MNRFAVLALYAPLFTTAALAARETQTQARTQTLVGGYSPADLRSPLVLKARAKIQKYFQDRHHHLMEIQEAATQVVAGTNIKLVCKVTATGEPPSVWEYVIWQKLGDQDEWVLMSAIRVSPTI
jgi:hypothetical protein